MKNNTKYFLFGLSLLCVCMIGITTIKGSILNPLRTAVGYVLVPIQSGVNRVGGGKKHGLIIDYNGMIKSLRRALATFAQGDRAGTGKGEAEQDTVRDDAEALMEYADSLKAATEFLMDLGFDVDELVNAKGFDKQKQILVAVNLLCESDERRKTYQVIVEDVQARHRGLFPHPGLFDFDAVESAVTAIYNKMQDARVSPDVSSLLQDLYDVVDVAVATDAPSVREPTARYDLSNIDFSRLRAEFEKSPFKNVVAMNLMEKIEERLAAMVARNPTRVDLYVFLTPRASHSRTCRSCPHTQSGTGR